MQQVHVGAPAKKVQCPGHRSVRSFRISPKVMWQTLQHCKAGELSSQVVFPRCMGSGPSWQYNVDPQKIRWLTAALASKEAWSDPLLGNTNRVSIYRTTCIWWCSCRHVTRRVSGCQTSWHFDHGLQVLFKKCVSFHSFLAKATMAPRGWKTPWRHQGYASVLTNKLSS